MAREETLAKIFTVFMPQLTEELNVREIAKKAGISYDAAYRHVVFMKKAHMLKQRRVGQAVVCSLDLSNLMARKYLEKTSICKTEEFLKKDVVLRKLFSELVTNMRKAAQNELLCIVLFGSFARGEQKQHSDIDILVISSTFAVREKLERECDGIGLAYGRDISLLLTTAAEFEKMLSSKKLMVAHEVQRDGIVLYGFENYFTLLSEGVSND